MQPLALLPLLVLASSPAAAHVGGYPVEEQPALLLAAVALSALLGALLFLRARGLRDDALFALRTVAARHRRFLLLVLAMAALATGFNLLLLAAVTGHPPGAAGLGGTYLNPEQLPLEESAVSLFDTPLLWVEYPQWFDEVNDPSGAFRGMLPRASIPLRWSLTPHYLADMLPLVVLLAAYMVLAKRPGRGARSARTVGAAALPGAGSASTALAGIAASVCCGAVTFSTTAQVVAVAGVAVASSSLVLFSRVFIAAMALLLVLLVLRASRQIRTCAVAAGGGGL